MKKTDNRLVESSFVLVFSTVLVKIIGAIFKIPLASETFLGKVGFGYFSVAYDIYMPFYLLAVNGLPTAVSHIVSNEISSQNDINAYKAVFSFRKLYFSLGLILSILILICILPIFIFSNNTNESYYSIIAIIPAIFLCFIVSAYRGYFEGKQNMYPTAISRDVEAIAKLFLGLFFAYITMKITGNIAYASAATITSISIGNLVSVIYLHFKFKKNIKHNYDINNKNNFHSNSIYYLKLTLPFAFVGLSASIVALLDVFTVKIPLELVNKEYISIVTAQHGAVIPADFSAYLYGIRSEAYTIYNLIPTFTTVFGVSALPLITSFLANNKEHELKKNINYSIKLITTVTFPAAIGLTVLSGPVMSLLYSGQNITGENILKIYGITAIFSGIAIPLITILQSIGKKKTILINIFISILIKILVSYSLVLIPKINIYSAAIGTLACYFYLFISIIVIIKSRVGKTDVFNTIVKPLFSALLCGLTAYLISSISNNNLTTIIGIITAIIIYFTILFLTKCFSKEELNDFPIINKFLFKNK